MSKTKIEWADMTINPVVGCSKCSPGCDHCYAERIAARLAKNPLTEDYYARVVDANGWTGKINNALHWGARNMPHRVPGKSKRVFVGSMTDLFHPNVGEERLDTIFASILFDAIISNGHGHSYLLLTKRADRMREYFAPGPEAMLRRWGEAGDGWLHLEDGDEMFSGYAEGQTIPLPGHEKHPMMRHEFLWPLPNVWLGVTVCNQVEADAKIPILLDTPAAKRFVSVEPMLGPVNLVRYLLAEEQTYQGDDASGFIDYEPLLHWVICGGETGPGARPLHPEWVRSLRYQCDDDGVSFFFKGWGEWTPAYLQSDGGYKVNSDADIPHGFEAERHVFAETPDIRMYKVGKKRAGRLLDGLDWTEIPGVTDVNGR